MIIYYIALLDKNRLVFCLNILIFNEIILFLIIQLKKESKMVADRETVDKNKELVKKKELINLQTELADAYYECTKHRGRIGDLAPYEDDNILKESGVKIMQKQDLTSISIV